MEVPRLCDRLLREAQLTTPAPSAPPPAPVPPPSTAAAAATATTPPPLGKSVANATPTSPGPVPTPDRIKDTTPRVRSPHIVASLPLHGLPFPADSDASFDISDAIFIPGLEPGSQQQHVVIAHGSTASLWRVALPSPQEEAALRAAACEDLGLKTLTALSIATAAVLQHKYPPTAKFSDSSNPSAAASPLNSRTKSGPRGLLGKVLRATDKALSLAALSTITAATAVSLAPKKAVQGLGSAVGKVLRPRGLAPIQGERLWVLESHSSRILSLASHPTDPLLLATSSMDYTVRLWDLEARTQIAAVWDRERPVRGLYFVPGRDMLVHATAGAVGPIEHGALRFREWATEAEAGPEGGEGPSDAAAEGGQGQGTGRRRLVMKEPQNVALAVSASQLLATFTVSPASTRLDIMTANGSGSMFVANNMELSLAPEGPSTSTAAGGLQERRGIFARSGQLANLRFTRDPAGLAPALGAPPLGPIALSPQRHHEALGAGRPRPAGTRLLAWADGPQITCVLTADTGTTLPENLYYLKSGSTSMSPVTALAFYPGTVDLTALRGSALGGGRSYGAGAGPSVPQGTAPDSLVHPGRSAINPAAPLVSEVLVSGSASGEVIFWLGAPAPRPGPGNPSEEALVCLARYQHDGPISSLSFPEAPAGGQPSSILVGVGVGGEEGARGSSRPKALFQRLPF